MFKIDDIKKYLKKTAFSSLWMSIILLIVAFFLLIKSESFINNLIIIVGVALSFLGIVNFISYLKLKDEEKLMSRNLLNGLLMIIFGLIAIFKSSSLVSIFTIILGIYLIYQNLEYLHLATNLKNLKDNKWYILMILSLLNIIFGIIVVINPFETIVAIVKLSAILIILSEAFNIFQSLYMIFKLK